MDDGRRGAPRWLRSSQCYAGNCVEARADDGVVLLRDSKHPDRKAIALDFPEWSAFMNLVRDSRWGDSFDLVSTAANRPVGESEPVGTVHQSSRVLI